jgi:hypothetical protein
MKIISPTVHGVIDYLVVIFLFASPMYFGMTGIVSTFTYALSGVHLLLTVLTNFKLGFTRVIPFKLHGTIELIVGIALIALAFTLFKSDALGKMYYAIFGAAVLLVYVLTDYKAAASKI